MRDKRMSLYTAEIQDQLHDSDPATRHRSGFDAVRDADFLNQMLYLDTKIFMAESQSELQRQDEHGIIG